MRLLRMRERLADAHIHFRSTKTIGAKASRAPRLAPKARLEFLNSCWDLVISDVDKLQPYQSYFRHYEEFCSYISVSYPVLEECTHEHFCLLVKILHLYEQSSLRHVFPDNFLDETQRTLSLMLPLSDKACRSWFTSTQQSLKLDMAAGDCRNLRLAQRNIQHFDFRRDRLIIAKEAYDLSQPVSLLQFWRDDRNKVQWWTFWIAIVVFLLTLIGIIEGALQVYKAYYPS